MPYFKVSKIFVKYHFFVKCLQSWSKCLETFSVFSIVSHHQGSNGTRVCHQDLNVLISVNKSGYIVASDMISWHLALKNSYINNKIGFSTKFKKYLDLLRLCLLPSLRKICQKMRFLWPLFSYIRTAPPLFCCFKYPDWKLITIYCYSSVNESFE